MLVEPMDVEATDTEVLHLLYFIWLTFILEFFHRSDRPQARWCPKTCCLFNSVPVVLCGSMNFHFSFGVGRSFKPRPFLLLLFYSGFHGNMCRNWAAWSLQGKQSCRLICHLHELFPPSIKLTAGLEHQTVYRFLEWLESPIHRNHRFIKSVPFRLVNNPVLAL